MEKVKQQVKNALHYYSVGNIGALQQQLYELYLNFNKVGGGKYILEYPNKDELAECFTLMLRYDWIKDNGISEVWAENGFYCIIEYIINQANTPIEKATAGLDLFIHLCEAREFLKPKIQNILNKAVVLRNPIFQDHFINNNASYLIDQFMYLSAKMIQPLIKMHGNLLLSNYKKEYDNILLNRNIEQCYNPNLIINKAYFVANIVESVLEDM